MMRILEIAYTWPAETFIQRHVLALREAGLDVCLVARQGTTFQQSWASIGEARRDIPARVMPNFDHLVAEALGQVVLTEDCSHNGSSRCDFSS